jgi:peptide/nickel transport system permease protein
VRRFQRFFSRWQNWIGVLLILIYVGAAIFAPYLAPLKENEPENVFVRVGRPTEGKPLPPDENAMLGQLPFGISVFHPLIWGSRDALIFGLIVTITTALFGVVYGAISGFAGNRLSNLMIRVADSFLAFPPIAGFVFFQQLFATTVTALGGMYFYAERLGQIIEITGPVTAIQVLVERVNPLMLSLILFSWMPYARLVHSIVLTLKQTEFIQAARALGGSSFWIIRKHILRNSTGPAIVLAARDVGGVVLLQATLTFIGIGGGSIWGQMLSQGRNWVLGAGGSLLRYWWVFVPPTLAVMLFGIAWNMFGDGLNDVLEPTTQGQMRRSSFWSRWMQRAKTKPSPEARVPLPPVPEIVPQIIRSNGEQAVSIESNQTPVPDANDPILQTARQGLAQGDLPRALHAYKHLIRRNKSVDEFLPDLAQLVKTYPHDPQAWQTLGDALTRAGDADHAALSYERAEKLKQQQSSS